MENYIGAKIIKAELTTLDIYKQKKYGETANIEKNDKNIKGYIVYYPPIGNEDEKPYISWSPQSVFEKAYRIIENAEISLINGFWGE
ncbi:MAG: hypothetical protein ACFFDH_00500 [Promethearchaeota archaeon]